MSSKDFVSDLVSSNRVVSEEVLDKVDVSDGLCVVLARDCVLGWSLIAGVSGTAVSPAWAAEGVWNTLPRERILPNEARRECARDLTDEATVLGFESTLSAAGASAVCGCCCRWCESADGVAAGGRGDEVRGGWEVEVEEEGRSPRAIAWAATSGAAGSACVGLVAARGYGWRAGGDAEEECCCSAGSE